MKVGDLTSRILVKRDEIPQDRAELVGISGIDASGKGFVAQNIAGELDAAGLNVALINADAWLDLPQVRFASDRSFGTESDSRHRSNAGLHFYNHALRLDAMFENLVIPLSRARSAETTIDYASETDLQFSRRTYVYQDVDIILLEGIFIYKQRFVPHFDLRIWTECSFNVALERAVRRRQENLSAADTVKAYERIYFPAQHVHIELDDPIATADVIYPNG